MKYTTASYDDISVVILGPIAFNPGTSELLRMKDMIQKFRTQQI
jgi:hypothetical protein